MIEKKKKIYTEKMVDNSLKKAVEASGGLYLKMHPMTNAGIPDRIIHIHNLTFYVELKTTGEKCTPLQEEMHKRIYKSGTRVYVLDTLVTDYWDLYHKCYTTYQSKHYSKNPHKDINI